MIGTLIICSEASLSGSQKELDGSRKSKKIMLSHCWWWNMFAAFAIELIMQPVADDAWTGSGISVHTLVVQSVVVRCLH